MNTEYSDPLDIAEIFNKYFNEIVSSLDNSLPVNQLNPLQYEGRVSDFLFLYPITNVECTSIISNLKITKQHINKIPVQFFIENQSYYANIICDLINLCYVNGQFPNCLKMASITPIYKSGD